MRKMTTEELRKVEGGSITFNATYLNAIYKISSLLFEIGKELGSSIRRFATGSTCPVK